MDTIRTYLENMFLSLPRTPETLRAKEELFSMMEDKYAELKASGKSENEAIGTVIAEFGNLEELAAELHLNDKTGTKSDSKQEYSSDDQNDWFADAYSDVRTVTADEADDFLEFSRRSAFRVALGVLLCIFSPVPLIYLAGLTEFSHEHLSEELSAAIGLLALFLSVAIAVMLFMLNSMKQHQYDYLKQEPFRLDFGTTAYLKELYSQFSSSFAVQITIGVLLCVFSPVPLIGSSLLFEDNEMLLIIFTCLLLLMVAAGVFLFVQSGMMSDSYKLLLSKENLTHAYSQTNYHKSGKRAATRGALFHTLISSYYSIVTIVYFIWSFSTMDWHITWIIWLIAPVIHKLLISIWDAADSSKKDR